MAIYKAGLIAVSGMKEAAKRLEISSHNIANASTNGFKATEMRSADVVSNNQGAGVGTLAVYHSTEFGPLISTGRTTNVAISGNGYFVVQDENGRLYYTRNGSFHKNAQGYLVNDSGYRVVNAAGVPIPQIPDNYTQLQIGSDGKIWAIDGDGRLVELGPDYTIGIAMIQNEQAIQQQGQTLYTPSVDEPTPDIDAPGIGGRGTLLAGFVEGSNVDIAEEMVNTLLAKRMYEANVKVVETSSKMMESLLDIKT